MSRTRRQRLLTGTRRLRPLTARRPDAGLLRSQWHLWARTQVPLVSLPWLSASDPTLSLVARVLGDDPDELHASLVPGWVVIDGRPLAYGGHRVATDSADHAEPHG